MIYGGHFDVLGKKEKIKELEDISMRQDFWNDQELANKTINEMNSLKEIVNIIESLKSDVNNDLELCELLLVSFDEDLLHNLEEDINIVCQKLEKAEVYLLLNGPYDKNNCLLEIHSGAGGTEACDWADMLFRMYLRYLEKNDFKYEVLSYLDGDEVGLKSASIKVIGLYAYGYLKSEKGVHRLVRLSPFDANHKRHTSFASVDITPEFDNNIDVKIDEKDLKIDVYRASGAGGQHVNRTESAVRITHLPTKIVVTCQNERSQLQNKETCMNVLRGKLKLLEIEKQQQEMSSIKGDSVITSFGSQIRSYVMHPYSLVKDHRTGYETSNVLKVLDGDIEGFIESFLKG